MFGWRFLVMVVLVILILIRPIDHKPFDIPRPVPTDPPSGWIIKAGDPLPDGQGVVLVEDAEDLVDLGRRIHANGQKFGVCVSVIKTYGKEYQTMKELADAGVDYVRLDVGTWWPRWNFKTRYYLLSDAMQEYNPECLIEVHTRGFGRDSAWYQEVGHFRTNRNLRRVQPVQSSIESDPSETACQIGADHSCTAKLD